MTFDRFAKIIPTENIYIVTNESYADLIKEQLPELAEEQILLNRLVAIRLLVSLMRLIILRHAIRKPILS